MSNPQHVEWLLQGVDAWNKRRKETPFIPDLSGADLSYSWLHGANLSHSRLYGTNLSAANLTLANLTGALAEKADLRSADLNSAVINCADLRGASLIGTKLRGTEPWKAKLFDTPDGMAKQLPNLPSHLEITSLGGLLEDCRTLREYYSKDNRIPGKTQESIAMELRRLEREGPVIPEIVFYFRGEPCNCKSWELRPSVMRSQTNPKLRNSEGRMLFDLMSRQPEEFSMSPSALEQWVLAQHYELKTRLLDVTRNPLVSLFNACQEFPGCDCGEVDADHKSGRLHIFVAPRAMVRPFNSDVISVVANFAKLRSYEQALILGKREGIEPDGSTSSIPPDRYDAYSEAMRRLYHFTRQEKPYFDERIEPRHLFEVFIVEPRQSFARIRAQSGSFLISAFHERFEAEQVSSSIPGITIYEQYVLSVPSETKEAILEDLRLLNVTRESLYPGLEEAAAAVMEKFSG